eukprot:2854812-Lingulodinium_polyedra.AAC.1
MENPQSSWFWRQPAWVRLRSFFDFWTVDYCRFGTLRRRSTFCVHQPPGPARAFAVHSRPRASAVVRRLPRWGVVDAGRRALPLGPGAPAHPGNARLA